MTAAAAPKPTRLRAVATCTAELVVSAESDLLFGGGFCGDQPAAYRLAVGELVAPTGGAQGSRWGSTLTPRHGLTITAVNPRTSFSQSPPATARQKWQCGEDGAMAEQVQIVRINAAAEHRRREVRKITVVIAAVGGVAVAGAVVPLVDDLAGALVIGAVLTVVARLTVKWVARRVRWWFEDRADARAAAAWRAGRATLQAAGADTDRVAAS